MGRNPHYDDNNFIQVYCPKCNNELYENINFEVRPGLFIRKCETCNNARKFFKCTCGFYIKICPSCTLKKSKKGNRDLPQGDNIITVISKSVSSVSVYKCKSLSVVLLMISLMILLIIMCWSRYDTPVGIIEGENAAIIKKLKKDYPSQKNETWYNFLGILEKEIPSVKSITFLHGKDEGTSDCLANELVFLYTKNKNIKSEEITFSSFKAADYGFILEHYHKIVKKFGVFITDLNKVSGNVARIFHSLCDEVSSDIKPSLFIFTLKYDERTETLKPVERATSVLRKTWNDLPESELFPLLSRVVKNVVDIVPEDVINC